MDLLELNGKPVKVLVTGDVCGQFQSIFKKVKLANDKAGPFDLLLCVGEFFSPTHSEVNKKLLQGDYIPCIPTYILGPCTPQTSMFYPEEEGAEITANVTYLGHKGTLTTAQGISIAYLSGIEASNPNDMMEHEFDGNTVKELLVPISASDYNGVDILLTSQWPESVHKYCSNGLSDEKLVRLREAGAVSSLITRVAAVSKPRYHFAGLGGVHYERQPYRNHRVLQEMAQQCTRFVGLAKVGNTEKAKSLYAFNVKPMRKMKRSELVEQPPDASEFPYASALADLSIKESMAKPKEDKSKQYFFDNEARMEEEDTNRRRKGKRNFPGQEGGPGSKREPAGPCWFCLSSPEVEKHLVVSVGESCYMALAKGGLSPEHVLILPIAHVQSTVSAPKNVRDEIEAFKKALVHYFAEQKQSVVLFERNYRTQHLQIQAVPVPPTAELNLKTAFLNESELRGFELNRLEEECEIWDMVNEGCPYFLLNLPNGERYFTRQMKAFPIQFGREVIAGPAGLNTPDKIDWKECKVPKSTEMKWANAFKRHFQKYDPNN